MKEKALSLLREMTSNPNAEFHDGQFQSISQLVEHHAKLLVVQKTGWGKSAVYFIATKLLRQQGKGPTIIISPLLALMRNQIERAQELGLKVVSINSSQTPEENIQAKESIKNKSVDAVIISPEQLANEEMIEDVLIHIISDIGLFVVDEAHCISDWGHDFRPDYRRIVRILNHMPPNMPILATTATANHRVINDIHQQLGQYLQTIRGDLKRKSLFLQNIPTTSRAERMAWLAEHIPQLKGTGIVYVKAVRDGEVLASWLNHNGIQSASYSGGADNKDRVNLEQALLSNSIKVLVATSALGMGFDKPDLSFVIHFQFPGSLIEYYQQVGRAGRGIDHAYGILMNGPESQEIQSYFINNAFPKEDEVKEILETLESSIDGLSIYEIEANTNLNANRIKALLKFLDSESPSPIYKGKGGKYYRNDQHYQLPYEHIRQVTANKIAEWQHLNEYHETKSCLMKELTAALDDPLAQNCGNCMNCMPSHQLHAQANPQSIIDAHTFLKRRYISIKPKKQFGRSTALARKAFTKYEFPFRDAKIVASEGLALSSWKDGGWGNLVAKGKYNGHFSDELIEPMVTMIKSMRFEHQPKWLSYIPSLRNPELVKNFAYRLAAKLGIPCRDALVMTSLRPPQKEMQNSFKQSQNLDGAFRVDLAQCYSDPMLLLDDAVDSGWTFTVATALLRREGIPAVYPIALTSTARQDQGE